MKTIGTCSICAGAVQQANETAAPECAACGAVAAQHHGPVIEMRPRPHYVPYFWSPDWTYPLRPWTFTTVGARDFEMGTAATTDTVTLKVQ